MKTIQKYIAAGLVVGSLVGCKDKMTELNSNPNTVSTTNMEYLFTGATDKFDFQSRGQMIDRMRSTAQIMQYVVDYGEGSKYVNPQDPGGNQVGSWGYYYNQYFGGQGNKLQTILDLIERMPEAEKLQHTDIKAIVQVLAAYQQWRNVEYYGAIVYSEAFQAITNSITQPKYDMGKDIYKDIDATLKSAIDALSQPEVKDNRRLGNNDFFNGYKSAPVTSGGASLTSESDYITQRTKWLKFANMFRLEMAWKLKATDNTFFEKVKGEVLSVTNGFMTSIADGTYYNYAQDYDNNPDDIDALSQYVGVSENLVNSLKALKDPRLQYYARPNGLSSINSRSYRFMKAFFNDSLAKYDLLEDGNIFVGETANPLFKGRRLTDKPDAVNPNFPGQLLVTFNLINPNFPDPLVIVDPKDPQRNDTMKTAEKEFSLSLQIVSPAQARYFVKCGGKSGKNGTSGISEDMENSLRWDGPGGEWTGLYLRTPIFTYPQQCFMFAHLGITIGGKSPADWYKEGVRSALVEARDNALRMGIQVATNSAYPVFPEYNPDGLFVYTDAQIEEYVNARTYSPEDAINQAWIYFYVQPEVAYSWWKTTGYPKFVENTTPAQAATQTNVYLEQPYLNSTETVKLAIPRRGQLPDRNTTNVNFLPIKNALEASPNFLQWQATQGRVWWDVNGL